MNALFKSILIFLAGSAFLMSWIAVNYSLSAINVTGVASGLEARIETLELMTNQHEEQLLGREGFMRDIVADVQQKTLYRWTSLDDKRQTEAIEKALVAAGVDVALPIVEPDKKVLKIRIPK